MIGQKSLVIFGSQWAGYAVLLVSGVMAARLLGPTAIGQMAFAFGVLGLVFVVTSLGFAQAHLKRIAEGKDIGECLGTFAVLQVVLNVLAVGAAVLVFPLLDGQFRGSSERAAFFLFVGFQSFTSLGQVFTVTLQGKQLFARAAAVTLGGRATRLAAIATLLFASPSLETLALCFALEALIAFGLGAWLSGFAREARWPTRASFSSYWTYARPLAITAPLSTGVDSLDRVVLGSRFGATSVGYYNVALTIYEAIKTFPAAVISASFPRLSQEFARGGAAALKMVFVGYQRKLLMVATPIAVLGIFWSSDAIRLLYGPSFSPAGPVLAILFGLFWFICVATPYTYVLYATDQHQIFVWLSLVSNALFVLALWALCSPRLGLAATGVAAAAWVPHVAGFPFVLRRTAKLFDLGLTRIVILCGVLGGLMLGVGAVLLPGEGGFLVKLALSAGVTAGYVAGLRATGELRREELTYFSHVLNPVYLLNSIRSDFRRNP